MDKKCCSSALETEILSLHEPRHHYYLNICFVYGIQCTSGGISAAPQQKHKQQQYGSTASRTNLVVHAYKNSLVALLLGGVETDLLGVGKKNHIYVLRLIKYGPSSQFEKRERGEIT